MPQAAAIFVAGIVNAAIAGTAGIVAGVIAGYATFAAVAIGISYALSSVSQALMGRPKLGSSASWRQMTVKAPTAARAIVYGEITTGGVLVFQHTTGDKNQYLDFVIVLAGHQVTEITDVWVDDVLVTKSQINSGNTAGGAVTTGELGPKKGNTILWIYKFLGTSGQTASTVLSATDGFGYGPDTWTTDHRLRGCAYVHIRARRVEYWANNGAPSQFRFRVKGAKVYDPRLDSTNGGSGSHRLADATTWAYSNNPALVAADYVAGGTIGNDVATPVRKRGFGVKTPATDIDWSAVIAAANICDEDVSIPGSTTQNRYECDLLVVPSDDSPDSECLDQILSSMVGQMTYTRGKYILHAGTYDTPTYTLTTGDLAGPIQYVAGQGRSERYNYVRGTRYDVDKGIETEFLSRTDSGYVSDDGATLYHDIELPGTANEYRAQRIAQLILRRSREQQTIIWPGQASAAKVGIWETVSVTVAELGITNKVFRCIARKRRSGANGEPLVELTLREEFTSTYNDPLTTDYGSISVAADPGPVTLWIDAPTNLTATSLAGAITFTITPPDDVDPGTVYDLYQHTSSTPFSSASLVWSGASTNPTIYTTDTTTRYYWVRARCGAALSTQYPATTGVSGAGANQPISGLVALLSNEAHTLPAASDGTVSSYTGSGTEIRVYEGATLLDYDATGTSNGTWKATVSATNITAGSVSGTGSSPNRYATVAAHSAMTADNAYIDFAVSGKSSTGASFAYNLRQSLAKSKAGATGSTGSTGATGAAGANAKLLYLYSTAQTVSYNTSGGLVSGQSIAFTLVPQNLSTSTYTVSMTDFGGTARNANTYLTGSGTVTTSGNDFTQTGTTVTLTGSNFDTARNSTGGVIVTVSHADGVSDKISIAKVQDGAAGSTGATGPTGATGADGNGGFTWDSRGSSWTFTPTSATRASGGGPWNIAAWSKESVTGGAFVSAQQNNATLASMIGLTDNIGTASTSEYANIDYAFYTYSATECQIYQSGSLITTLTGLTLTTSTIFSIHYDGAYVRYYIDGVEKGTAVSTTSGRKFQLMSAVYNDGGGYNNIRFVAAGPQGPTGATGATGATGPTGPAGTSALAVRYAPITGTASGAAATGNVSATAGSATITNGDGTYTYSWTRAADITGAVQMTINSSTSATPTFSGTAIADGDASVSIWQVVLTETSSSRTAAALVSVSLLWIDTR